MMMRFVLRQYSQFDKLNAGRFGILEPPGESLIAHPQHIDVFVVPGVVFDCQVTEAATARGIMTGSFNPAVRMPC